MLHVGCEQLQHIFVACHNHDIMTGLFRLMGQCADNIVRLVPGHSDGRNVKCFHNTMNVGDLCASCRPASRGVGPCTLEFFMP